MTLKVFRHIDIAPLVAHRPLETKLGEALMLLPQGDDLADRLAKAKQLGARFAILGVPEDLGPKANMGRGGSQLGWQAFLSRFLNLQSHGSLAPQSILLLGELELNDLQEQGDALSNQRPEQLARLRDLVGEVDKRLRPVIKALADAGLIPIVIGGGHNNAYPILAGMHDALGQPLAVLNVDPHADFRPPEGRHSGNGFRYAHDEGALAAYQVLAFNPLKNSASSQQALAEAGFGGVSYQQLYVERSVTLGEALTRCSKQLLGGHPTGLELDLDAISFLPASAYTNAGMPLADAEHLIFKGARLLRPSYLHLCEGAPARHPAGSQHGMSDVGQATAALVTAFIQAMND
ncbi:formimidoylglutamase [Gallaecimonas sp. GXIMD4217]|uniref:formimidoylglutamase n=1 Tax=Gallaecimonas sp. GXIMD4217 TaxID=3131927 RepID=UPI00311B0F84